MKARSDVCLKLTAKLIQHQKLAFMTIKSFCLYKNDMMYLSCVSYHHVKLTTAHLLLLLESGGGCLVEMLINLSGCTCAA